MRNEYTHKNETAEVTVESISDEHIRDFMLELQRKMSWVHFRQIKHYSSNKVFVFDDSPFPLGWISYGVFTDTGETKQYVVCAHSICNNKYASYSEQQSMLMSKRLKTAVSNACRYLQPWVTGRIAEAGMNTLRQARASSTRNLDTELREKMVSLGFQHNAHHTAQVSSGATNAWTTCRAMVDELPEGAFQQGVREATQIEWDLFEDKNMNTNATFICIKKSQYGDDHLLFTVPVPKAVVNGDEHWDSHHSNYFESKILSPIGDTKDRYEELAEYVNRLTVLEDQTYVRGVGMKLTEDMFYVHDNW
jgi:hypothetical protein